MLGSLGAIGSDFCTVPPVRVGARARASATSTRKPPKRSQNARIAPKRPKTRPDGLAGVLLDPPYSREQISRHYRSVGRLPTALDTSNHFLARVQDVLAMKVRPGGHAISCGWTGIGLGRVRRFEEIRILLMVHGPGHYATHIVVERKVDHAVEEYEP